MEGTEFWQVNAAGKGRNQVLTGEYSRAWEELSIGCYKWQGRENSRTGLNKRKGSNNVFGVYPC